MHSVPVCVDHLTCTAQAADALRVTGVGRNEYISIMNACKAKKLMWRVNKGIARDLLPAAPLDIKMEGWWVVHVVNVGEGEHVMNVYL